MVEYYLSCFSWCWFVGCLLIVVDCCVLVVVCWLLCVDCLFCCFCYLFVVCVVALCVVHCSRLLGRRLLFVVYCPLCLVCCLLLVGGWFVTCCVDVC